MLSNHQIVRPLFCSMLSLLFIGCNNEPAKEKEAVAPPAGELINCYRYVNKKDTVILKTTNVNGTLTGILVYNFYEKDKTKGTIQGGMNGDILIADYTFESEAATSVRQVVFKKTGNDFEEGHGDMSEVNGKMMFKNIDSLKFDHSILLASVKCE